MKLICLNVWGGRAGIEGLRTFFEQHKADTDVFCLQEVYSGGKEEEAKTPWASIPKIYDLFSQICLILHETHAGFFRPTVGDWYGPAIFLKKELTMLREDELFVYRKKGDSIIDGNHLPPRNIQYVTFQTPHGNRTVINFHGLWNGEGKGDSEDRLKQSDMVSSFLKTLPDPYVLCGDFNLSPETESLARLERMGLRNLIKEYGITSTRTRHYPKAERFADYVLVPAEIKVNDFRVLSDEVSDHSPLCLDFV